MIKKIALCDSGIGGIFLLAKLVKLFPDFQYLYISDKDNLPYGNKTKKQIKGYCINAINTVKKFNADMLIVACNTMSEVGEQIFIKNLKIPVFFVRHDIRKILCSNMKNGRFYCTFATAKSKQIKAFFKLEKSFVVPCKNLAFEIENNALNLANYCPSFLKKTYPEIKKVYLGCTHYVLILNKFKKAFPNAKFFDGSEQVITILKQFLFAKNTKINRCEKTFVGSGNMHALRVFKTICSKYK